MALIKVEQFGGMLPAWGAGLLPEGQAADATNCYLFSGELTGWRKPKKLRDLTNSAAQFAYRVPTTSSSRASAFIVFTSNADEGDTVSVQDDKYTFTATVTNQFDVLIGSTAEDTTRNFLAALTFDYGQGTNEGVTYGQGCVQNSAVEERVGYCIADVSGLGYYVKVVAPDFGAAFNSQVLSESTAGARILLLTNPNDAGTATTVFAGGVNETFDSAIDGTSTWLEFEDPYTSVMRSLTVDDQFKRFYWASPSQPPMYNTYDRIIAGQNPWLLGVPAPGCAPGVTVSGGGNEVTLGLETSTSSGNITVAANSAYLYPITPNGALSLDSVSFMPGADATTASMAACIYDDNGGIPGTLIAVGQPYAFGVTSGIETVLEFVNPPGLTDGVQYWVGFITDTELSVVVGNGKATSVAFDNTFSNGPPAVLPGTYTTAKDDLQMWFSCTTQDVLEARSYVYTWVTEYAEEGPPSPPTLLNGWSNGTWTVDVFQPPDDQIGVRRNIKTVNIYRTVSGTGGQTVYYFVDSIDIGTKEYVDTITDDVVVVNETLPSSTWFPPPFDLQDIKEMPNGIAVGFRGNELWFCEPYRPHAWPPGYVLTTEFPIVGIGVSGNYVVAATSAKPYVASGISPATMTLSKGQVSEPCNSRGSVIGTDAGVFYTSPNGLILVDQTGKAINVTELWVTRGKWAQLTPPATIQAVHLLGCYFAFGTVRDGDTSHAQDGFVIQMAPDQQSFTIWPQPGGHRIGFCKLDSPNGFDIDSISLDPWTGAAILVQDGAIYYYDFEDTAPTSTTYSWTSKDFQTKAKSNFAAMSVLFDIPDGTPNQNATHKTDVFTDASWSTLDADRYGYIFVYADHELTTVREIRTSNEVLRVVCGNKALEWQIKVVGRVNIKFIQMATSVKELQQV